MKENRLKERKQQLLLQGELLRYDLKINLNLVREGVYLGETGISLLKWLLERYWNHRDKS